MIPVVFPRVCFSFHEPNQFKRILKQPLVCYRKDCSSAAGKIPPNKNPGWQSVGIQLATPSCRGLIYPFGKSNALLPVQLLLHCLVQNRAARLGLFILFNTFHVFFPTKGLPRRRPPLPFPQVRPLQSSLLLVKCRCILCIFNHSNAASLLMIGKSLCNTTSYKLINIKMHLTL